MPELSGSVGPDEFGEGGGLLLLNGSAPTIAHNAIVGNSAVRTGGGLAIVYCSPTIVNNTIADNVATGARASGHVPGGGGLTAAGDPIIANNVITGNVAGVECWGRGGGICLPSGSATVATNVIAANSAWGGGGAYLAGSPTFTNTIIAFNTSGIANVGTAVPTLRNNCVFGNVAYDYDGLADPTGTDGNISADPLFVLPPAPGPDGTWGTADDVPGNLHLWPDSPCIDAGDNAFAVGVFDLDGLPRIVDGDGDGTATVDMGAYELQVLPPVCAGDSNCDGVINWRDVDFFVAAINDNRTAWAALHGPGAPPCPFANNDANADGTVNWRDIDPLVAVMNTVCP